MIGSASACIWTLPGFFVVLAVILSTGVLGGFRNWLAEDLGAARSRALLARRLIDATLAAATVPLFLTIVGNAKADAVFGEPQAFDQSYELSLFILIGFCSLAALFSQRFLDSLSKKVMLLSNEVDDVKQKIEETSALTEPLIEAELSAPTVAPATAANPKGAAVLRALTGSSFLVRSRGGLRTSTGLNEAELDLALEELLAAGLVRKLSTSKGARWAPTESGRAAVATV